jgi:putative ABC transport system permease protein
MTLERFRWPLWLRLAWRELRTGLAGFVIFIACIALGVMIITAVSTLSAALRTGLSEQGETLLGGDVRLTRAHARATATERAWLDRLGQVSESASLRTMARLVDGSDQALVELKSIDQSYPLVGAVTLDSADPLQTLLQSGPFAVVEPLLLERLGLKIGDTITIGRARITIRAVVLAEPDRISERASFGPRVLTSLATLEQTGLNQTGTLIRWGYAAKVSGNAERTPTAFGALRAQLSRELPQSGFAVTDRFDPAPELTRTLERLRQFLTLIGLTSLLVGGVGVANAVAAFIDKRRKTIAIMRSLGAPGALVGRLFLSLILCVAAIGIAIGLVLGTVVPAVVAEVYSGLLPFTINVGLSVFSVANAVAYGLLVALLFALWPLGRAVLVTPSELFRDDVSRKQTGPGAAVLVATSVVAATLLAFTALSSDAPWITLAVCAGIAVIFAMFFGVGWLLPKLARRLPRPRRPELALAVSALGAPGGLARSVVMSLGIGLTLLVAVVQIGSSILAELAGRLPDSAPAYFVLDVAKTDAAAMAALAAKEIPGSTVSTAPMLRGRITKLKQTPVEAIKPSPDIAWVLASDLAVTFAAELPEGSMVVDGQWWDPKATGEPLVSFDVEIAGKLGLAVGDAITVNVLGRELTARIGNLRKINWDNFNLNFLMVFSPSALQAAPFQLVATITLPKTAKIEQEVALARAMGKAFPTMTPIRVKDAIAQFNALIAKIVTAVSVASGVTMISGALVLAGALATAQRRRILDAVILKAIGVSRRRILISHLVEYGLLALIAALAALGLGAFAAWIVTTLVMELTFTFSWAAAAQAIGLAVMLALGFGGVGTIAVLRAPAVAYLKSE